MLCGIFLLCAVAEFPYIGPKYGTPHTIDIHKTPEIRQGHKGQLVPRAVPWETR